MVVSEWCYGKAECHMVIQVLHTVWDEMKDCIHARKTGWF